jgi:serine/threonine protein kinase/WD40 repeat protein
MSQGASTLPGLEQLRARWNAADPLDRGFILCAHQRRSWRAGQPVAVERYVDEFPALRADCSALFELVCNEIDLRDQRGETAFLAQFRERFPGLAGALARRFGPDGLDGPGACGAANGSGADGGSPAATELPTLLPGLRQPNGECTPAGIVPGYEILEEIGRGGMGIVYKARQCKLNRLVALKMVLAGAQASPEDHARFRREAEAVARLRHPNIIQIYEIDEHEGRPFFSLEFADGGSLADRLDGSPAPARPAARFVETLARAVQAAHQQGIVHRDLKPANVLLTPAPLARPRGDGHGGHSGTLDLRQWVPKIGDFGLAKQVSELEAHAVGERASEPKPPRWPTDRPATDNTRTPSGDVLGTPSYMAPEQAAGDTADIGPAADIYALGAMLYELLTGRPPFRAATPLDTVFQVLSAEPVPPRRLQPDLARDLETICLKCLEKNPRKRYASALALADELHRFLEGRPILARPVPFWERGGKWALRHKAAAALVVLLALLLVGAGVAGTSWYVQRLLRDVKIASEQSQSEQYFERVALAHDSWSGGRPDVAEDLIAKCPLDLRGWEWSYLRRLCTPGRFTIAAEGGAGLAVDARGRHLAVGCAGERVRLCDADTGQDLRSWQQVGPAVAINPDGAWLAASSRSLRGSAPASDVIVWDSVDGKEVVRLSGRGEVAQLAFSSNGRLAILGSDGAVTVRDVRQPSQVGSLPGVTGVVGIAWHPDGRHLACLRSNGMVDIRDVDGPAPVVRSYVRRRERSLKALPRSSMGGGIAFSPDGRLLACSAGNDLAVWDWLQADSAYFLPGHAGRVRSVAFSGDGLWLVSGGADHLVKIWNATSGENCMTLRGHASAVQDVAFGGSATLFSRDTDRVIAWDVQSLEQQRPGRRGLAAAAVLSDCRHVADVRGQSLVVRDLEHADKDTSWACPRGVSCAAAGPDRTWLAVGGSDIPVTMLDPNTGNQSPLSSSALTGAVMLAASVDGAQLAAVGGDERVHLWNVKDSKEVALLRGPIPRLHALAFSPLSGFVALAGADGFLGIWNPNGDQDVLHCQGHAGDVLAVAFAPDGKHLASAGADGTVRLWNFATLQEINRITAPDGPVVHLAFHPTEDRVAAAGVDGSVRLWEPYRGREILTLAPAGPLILDMRFGADGRRLVAIDVEGQASVWDATPVGAPTTTAARASASQAPLPTPGTSP